MSHLPPEITSRACSTGFRGSHGLQILSQSSELKGKQNSKDAEVFLPFRGFDLKPKNSQIRRHLGDIFSVMQGRWVRVGGSFHEQSGFEGKLTLEDAKCSDFIAWKAHVFIKDS